MTVSSQNLPLDTVLTCVGLDSTDTDIPWANTSEEQNEVSVLLSLACLSVPP